MEDTGETFVVKFLVPPQVTLLPEWDAMAWDHALKLAHEQGVIPVGPIMIDLERKTGQAQLVEGQPIMINKLTHAAGMGLEVVEVTATMMVGSRL